MGCCASSPLPISGEPSVQVSPPDPSTKSSGIRRHPSAVTELLRVLYPDCQTLYDGFQRGLRLNADGNCMGVRPLVPAPVESDDAAGAGGGAGAGAGAAAGAGGGAAAPAGPKMVAGDFVWKSYKTCAEERDQFGSALFAGDYVPENEDKLRLLGLFCKNRPEWVIAEQACNAYGGVSVPLYDTLGVEAVSFIVAQTEMRTVVASREASLMLLQTKREQAEQTASLQYIIQCDAIEDEERKLAGELNVKLVAWGDMLAQGKENHLPHNPPKPDDIATFCYTSGTTGDPKGVMLTHCNIVADMSAALLGGLKVNTTDVHLSYLPLAHMFERIMQAALWANGAAVGFYQGDTLKLFDDIKTLQPTVFPSVPRLYNKIYDTVMNGINKAGGSKAKLFHKAYAAKLAGLRENRIGHKMWDKVVFSKAKARMGLGRVRMLVTGSAPLAAHVMDFLKIVFGVPIFEGYGQTECAAAATLTNPNDVSSTGHVGGPLACNEIKLVSVEDMGYTVNDKFHGRKEVDGKVVNPGIPCLGRGEVCFRGHNVFVGYYKNPEKTAEARAADGWLHSGDIGLWTVEGNLRIIDRKKNIFKLSQGEYVAPEKIENVYARSSFVAQAFVYGDSLQSVLVGIIVPDADFVRTWAAEQQIGGTTLKEWAASPVLRDAILADIKKTSKEAGLKGFEIVKAIRLESTPFSAENNLLTPTFKLKRNVARDVYQSQIDEMYASGLGTVAGMTGLKQSEIGATESKVSEAAAKVEAEAAAVSSEAKGVSKEAETVAQEAERVAREAASAVQTRDVGTAKTAAKDAQTLASRF